MMADKAELIAFRCGAENVVREQAMILGGLAV